MKILTLFPRAAALLVLMLWQLNPVQASCEPFYTFNIEEGTFVFDNLTACDGGIYCWYVDDVLQVIDPEFSWTPAEAGDYEVCLNITYEGCSNWYCEELVVTPEDCSPCHIDIVSHDCGECFYVFQAEYEFEGDISWLISDGTVADGETLLHQFDAPGTYTICAMATTDACGSVSECFTVTTDCEAGNSCEGGAIVVSEDSDCTYLITVEGAADNAEIHWFVNGWDYGYSTSWYYSAYFEETLSIVAEITTPDCPEGYSIDYVVDLEGCGWSCWEYYEIVTLEESDCTAYLSVEGVYTINYVDWYVDGEYVSSEYDLAIEAQTGQTSVLVEAWVFPEGCEEGVWLNTVVDFSECWDACDEEFGIIEQPLTDCSTYLSVTNWNAYGLWWYVNGEFYTDGPGFDLINTTNSVMTYEIMVDGFIEGCSGLFEETYVVVLEPCDVVCDVVYPVTFTQYTWDCAGSLEIVGLESTYPVTWMVNGVTYTTEGNFLEYFDLISGETFEVVVSYVPAGCTEYISLDEYFYADDCFDPCEVEPELFVEYQEDCEIGLFVWGNGLYGQDWYVNNEYVSSDSFFFFQNMTGEANVFDITVVPYIEGCPISNAISYTVTLLPCNDPCNDFYQLEADFNVDLCTVTFTIPGLEVDEPIQWWLEGEVYTTEVNTLTIDMPEGDVFYINPQFTPAGCTWNTEIVGTFDVPECINDCNVWVGYELCDDQLWLYGESFVELDWYLNDEYIGSGQDAYAVLSGDGPQIVCACTNSPTCDNCECITIDYFSCPEPIVSYIVEGDELFAIASFASDAIAWTFYGNDTYQTGEGLYPDAFTLNGAGTYTLCYWDLECPTSCGDCMVIEIGEEDCIPFTAQVDLALPPGIPLEFIWELIVTTDLGEWIDSVQVVYDPEMDLLEADFCLPEGCYEFELQGPIWLEDYVAVVLDGASYQEYIEYEETHVLAFSLGDVDCGFIDPIEPMVALEAAPNPVLEGGILTVSITGKDASFLQLQELNGRVVHSIPNPQAVERISTSGLADGLYVLSVRTPAGLVTRKVIIGG